MTDKKPYLLRAIYQWIVDNGCTPHLVIACPGAGWVTGVPDHFLQDDTLVLNISPNATQSFFVDDDYCSFRTRFSGQPHEVFVSVEAIHALVARENGEGQFFELDFKRLERGPDTFDNDKEDEPTSNQQKHTSHLKILK